MPLLQTTSSIQLFFHIHFFTFVPIFHCSAHFSAPPSCTPLIHSYTTSLSQPPSATYLKQSLSSNGSLFSIACNRPKFPYLEHLITLLLPTFTLNFLLSHTVQTHSLVYTNSPLNHQLVLYHQQITANFSQTCVHLQSASRVALTIHI